MLSTSLKLAAGVTGLFLAPLVSTQCTSNLLIDDFSKSASATNSLGVRASDDGSMQNLTSSTTTKSLLLTPTPPNATTSTLSPSYFYESLPCLNLAAASGYTAVSFSLRAPAPDASFTLELQTRTSCSDAAYAQDWQTITGVANTLTTVTIPLSGWRNAKTNLGVVSTLAWATWTWDTAGGNADGVWEMAGLQLVCGGASGGSSAAASSAAASSAASSATAQATTTPTTSATTTAATPTTTTATTPNTPTTTATIATTPTTTATTAAITSTKATSTTTTAKATSTTTAAKGKKKVCFYNMCWYM